MALASVAALRVVGMLVGRYLGEPRSVPVSAPEDITSGEESAAPKTTKRGFGSPRTQLSDLASRTGQAVPMSEKGRHPNPAAMARMSWLARHAVAEVDDSRAEGAGFDEFEIHSALALGKERNAPPTSTG